MIALRWFRTIGNRLPDFEGLADFVKNTNKYA